MKPARHAVALVLLAFSGCRSSPGPPAAPAPSSTASEALPTPPSAEPSAIAGAEPSAEPSASAGAADPPPPAALTRPLLRERAEITVDGVKEEWRIEWTTQPSDACFDYAERSSCLCGGLTFGETGEFDVVRARPGFKEQRVHLQGTLQRWAPLPAERSDQHIDVAKVKKRPPVPLMHFGDYNHDSKEAEFVLQTEAGNPCARTPSMLVGVNFNTNILQIFGTGKHPNKPLVLEHKSEWEKVKAKNPLELIELRCGDHGAPNQVTLTVEAKNGVFNARESRYACSEDFSKVGKLISVEDYQ